MLTDDPNYVLHRLHQRYRKFQQRARYSRARSDDPRKELAGRVEHLALATLHRMGYRVSRCGYNDPWDLWCNGARIEVKGSTWSGRRYQAAIRNHRADVLLFGCQPPNNELVFFVIPVRAYAHTRNIAVWTEDPAMYDGQWAEYYQAWWYLDATINRLPAHRGWQPALFEVM